MVTNTTEGVSKSLRGIGSLVEWSVRCDWETLVNELISVGVICSFVTDRFMAEVCLGNRTIVGLK